MNTECQKDAFDNLRIYLFLRSSTTFNDGRPRSLYSYDWTELARKYRLYLRYIKAEQRRKEDLKELFYAWMRQTKAIQIKKVRQLGKICANIAAARARGSTEPEIFLCLI